MQVPSSHNWARASFMQLCMCGLTGLGRMEEPEVGKALPPKTNLGNFVLWQNFYMKICILEVDCDKPIFVLNLRQSFDCQHFEL